MRALLNIMPLLAVAAIFVGLNAGFGVPLWIALGSVAVIGLAMLVRQADLSAAPVRNRDEASANLKSELWTRVLDAVPDPAILLNRHDIVLQANERARRTFDGLRTGLHASSLTRNPEFFELLRRAQESDGLNLATIVERVPVQRNFTATAARLLPLASEQMPAMLVTFRDLTEVERVADMRTDFVTNASHELRTPLASLLGFIETLQGPARDDPKARERFLGIMAAQGQRMKRLIDDLLSLSRIEMHQHVRPTATVDLSMILEDVTASFEPIAAPAKIRLEFNGPAGQALILGDRDELVQLFGNLLQNAIKYGHEGGLAAVRLSRQSDLKWLVEISDDGPGIDPVHLPRLTERFYRVDVATSRAKGGTGLGLAIVKHIVNRHRGELAIRSTLGKGSIFAVGFDAVASV